MNGLAPITTRAYCQFQSFEIDKMFEKSKISAIQRNPTIFNWSRRPGRPAEIDVSVYFLQQGSTTEIAARFYQYYGARQWRSENGTRLKNWERLAWTWIFYNSKSDRK